MGELWVSHDELVEAIGDDGADLLCRAVGGVSTYIPRKPVAGSPLRSCFPALYYWQTRLIPNHLT